jgi:hypothetical protein
VLLPSAKIQLFSAGCKKIAKNIWVVAFRVLQLVLRAFSRFSVSRSDDVGDDENAKEPLVKVSGNPFFPMGYRENINLRTFTGL